MKSFQRSALLVRTLSIFFFFIPVTISVPFILLHGIRDQCSNGGIISFTQLLSNLSNSPGSCLEIGNGEQDSVSMPLMQQASIACGKVKQMKELSQADIPKCTSPVCQLLRTDVYSDYVQDHIAPSGYIKLPNEMSKYLEHSKYLPKLNNERPNQRNSIYKERFTSLHKLVLVMFQGDRVVIPKESCWFGYYPDGATTPLLPPQQTKLYTEDWIGLKTLDAAGKVKFVNVPGEHLQMAHDDVVKHVVPYLQNHPTFLS
ncbi:alpha/beta-Hydrolases superfamily protein [Raphanus sativus]|nr:alpha/beta-Hydrolases superfamily protein [Raphanus sativus]